MHQWDDSSKSTLLGIKFVTTYVSSKCLLSQFAYLYSAVNLKIQTSAFVPEILSAPEK